MSSEEMDEFLRALADLYLPRYENRVALTAEEVEKHGLRRVGDTYRIRHVPPLGGWSE